MLLAINAQNTFITLGCFSGEKLKTVTQLGTELRYTADQYACAIEAVLKLNGIQAEKISGAILCSVVPALNEVIRPAVKKLCKCRIITVSAGVKTGLNMKIDQPNMLGSDLVCIAVEAASRGILPCVAVDFGTATTFTCIDESGVLIGTAIAPGVRLSLEALRRQAAQLPSVTLDKNVPAAAKNTVDAIRSGVLNGTAAMTDGMLLRIGEQLGCTPKVYVTGQYADRIAALMSENAQVEENLALMGLYKIWERNQKK